MTSERETAVSLGRDTDTENALFARSGEYARKAIHKATLARETCRIHILFVFSVLVLLGSATVLFGFQTHPGERFFRSVSDEMQRNLSLVVEPLPTQ